MAWTFHTRSERVELALRLHGLHFRLILLEPSPQVHQFLLLLLPHLSHMHMMVCEGRDALGGRVNNHRRVPTVGVFSANNNGSKKGEWGT